jgi:TrbL/VirB6 plasmid conjugal transfer protein
MGDFLNNVLIAFTGTLAGWQGDIQVYGLRIASGIAVLGGCMAAVRAASKGTWGGWVFEIMFGFFKLALVVAVVGNIFLWGQGVIDMGTELASLISGQSPATITPTGFFNWGLELAGALINLATLSWWPSDWIPNLITIFIAYITIPVIWFCAAIILLMVQLQSAFCLALGPTVVAFSATEVSFKILVEWIWGMVGLALKIVAIVLILTEGIQLAKQWLVNLAGSSGALGILNYDAQLLIESLLLLYCLWKLPNIIQGMVGGSASLGLGEAIMGAMAGASARGAARAATAGAGEIAKQVVNAIKAIDKKIGTRGMA